MEDFPVGDFLTQHNRYQLLKNPEVLKKLVTEIRSSFSTCEDITMASVTSLKYELAVLEEALR